MEQSAIGALHALAHVTRLKVFRALVVAGPGGLSAGALAALTCVPASTLSQHLSRLVHAGLLQCRRHSRQIVYSVQVEPVRHLLGYLVEDCCQGRPELCGGLSVPAGSACETVE